jgi:hypothetical protein
MEQGGLLQLGWFNVSLDIFWISATYMYTSLSNLDALLKNGM